MSDLPKLELPHRQTVADGGKVHDSLDKVTRLALPIGAATSLADMQKDYSFFSPALLHMSGLMHDGVWVELQRALKAPLQLYSKRFDAQIFDGLVTESGSTAWNQVLYAVPKHQGEDVEKWILHTVLIDPDRKHAILFCAQTLTVWDPLAIEKKSLTPATIQITFFGLQRHDATFIMADNPKTGRPYLHKGRASQRARDYALLLQNDSNPLVGKYAPRSSTGLGSGGSEAGSITDRIRTTRSDPGV